MNPEPKDPASLNGENLGRIGKKVLVVEDELNVAELFLAHLSRFDCEPFVAKSGSEARLLLEGHSFKAAILDLNLPDEDGAGLATEWKRTGAIPRIIITTATASAFHDHSSDCSGADGFLPKPFTITDFDACFSDYFSLSEAQGSQSYFQDISPRENTADKLLRTEGEVALVKNDRVIFGKTAHHFANIAFAAKSSEAATSFALAEESAKQGDWASAGKQWHRGWQQL